MSFTLRGKRGISSAAIWVLIIAIVIAALALIAYFVPSTSAFYLYLWPFVFGLLLVGLTYFLYKSGKLNIVTIIVLIILYGLFISYIIALFQIGGNCSISYIDIQKSELTFADGYVNGIRGFSYDVKIWFMKTFLLCQTEEAPGFFGKAFYSIKGFLGFNKGFLDFLVPDVFPVGFLAGLWIWIIFLLADSRLSRWEKRVTRRWLGGSPLRNLGYKNSWLQFIGGSAWKIVPIAVAYGLLMQIPILNRALDIITFEPLFILANKGFFGYVLRSIIISFYIGFIPAAIEGWKRYRLVKELQVAVATAVANQQIMASMRRGASA